MAVIGDGSGKPAILTVGPGEGEAARFDRNELLIFITPQIVDPT